MRAGVEAVEEDRVEAAGPAGVAPAGRRPSQCWAARMTRRCLAGGDARRGAAEAAVLAQAHLDEHDAAAVVGDEVHLAAAAAHVAGGMPSPWASRWRTASVSAACPV